MIERREQITQCVEADAVEAADIGFLYPENGQPVLVAIFRSAVPAVLNFNAHCTFVF